MKLRLRRPERLELFELALDFDRRKERERFLRPSHWRWPWPIHLDDRELTKSPDVRKAWRSPATRPGTARRRTQCADWIAASS